jgi:hypothetical protein
MAVTNSDKRRVSITISDAELSTLLGQKAKAAGLIDFDPEKTEVFNDGQGGWECIFELTTPGAPA